MESNIKVIEKVGKNPGKHVVIMAGVHGNEVCGYRAFDELIPEINIENGITTFIYANLEASRQNKRFVEYNLNRCFLDDQPAEIANSLEGKTAKEIMPFLNGAYALLDIHSSDSSGSLKYIFCERNAFATISPFNIERVILGIDKTHPGSSDGYMYNKNKIGICVECGLHGERGSVETAKENIVKFLIGVGNISGDRGASVPKEIFETSYIYKNKNGPFKLAGEFRDFDEIKERTLIGYDGDKSIYVDKGDTVMFPDEPKNIGNECFLIIKKGKHY